MPRWDPLDLSLYTDFGGAKSALGEADRIAQSVVEGAMEISPRYQIVRVVLRWMALWVLAMSFFVGRMLWVMAPHLAWQWHFMEAGIPASALFVYLMVLGRRFDRALTLIDQQDEQRNRGNALMSKVRAVEAQLDIAIGEAEKRSEEERIAEIEDRVQQENLERLLRVRDGLRDAQGDES